MTYLISYVLEQFILEELFEVVLPQPYKEDEQYEVPEAPQHFVSKEEYGEDFTDSLIDLILQILKIILEEEGELEDNDDSESKSSMSEESKSEKSNKTNHKSKFDIPPILLFLDDAHKMDKVKEQLRQRIEFDLGVMEIAF